MSVNDGGKTDDQEAVGADPRGLVSFGHATMVP